MKKNILKYVLSFLLSVLVLGSASLQTFAKDEAYGEEYMVYAVDAADLLSDEEEAALYQVMEENIEFGNMAFVTTYSVEGYSTQKYAEYLYYEWFGNTPGALFLIDMENRELWIASSTAMHDKLSDGECDSITDNIYTYATDGDYFACAKECFIEINTVMNDGKIAHSMKYIDNAILALILGLVLNFIFVFTKGKKNRKPANVLVNAEVSANVLEASVALGMLTKVYSPIKSSGGGSGGGGGGGGGFSGGGGGHSF